MATNRRGGGRLPGNGDFAAMAARGRGKGSFTRIVLPVTSFFFSCGFVFLGFVASGIGSFVSAEEGVMLLRVGTVNEIRKTKRVSSVLSNHVFINSEFLRLRSYFSERFVTLSV
jgi:hypothetical protein